eukprot:Skav217964  [mRNA]  locus=scaffold3450:124613:131011:+ [translate_table: standard]
MLNKNSQKNSGTSEDEEVEYVRAGGELPRLPEWTTESAPVDYGDWLLLIQPMMCDLSASSAQWWELVTQYAQRWYQEHMLLTPIQRLKHKVEEGPQLKQKKWQRLERRAASLLLAAIPESQKEEVVSSKELSAVGILTRVMLAYQPGGLHEKAAVLNALESPPEAANIQAAIGGLRKWIRWRRRASDVGVSLPDPTVLMRGLMRITRKILNDHPDLSFRVSLARNQLQVDSVPTHGTIEQFSEHLLAELDSVTYQRKKEATGPGGPKVRKLDGAEGGKGGSKGKSKNEGGEGKGDAPKLPCKFFHTENGCRKGRMCTWSHEVKDEERRCYSCGSTLHYSSTCPTKRNATTKENPKVNAMKKEDDDGKKEDKNQTTLSDETQLTTATVGSSGEEDTMKSLLEEANRMLRSMSSTDQTGRVQEDKIGGLQRQLDELKRASIKVLRVSKLCEQRGRGLIDSGATHPLRMKYPKEKTEHYADVQVVLAGGKEVTMKLSPQGVLVADQNVEPIIPMGVLTQRLACDIQWNEDGLLVTHPKIGPLKIMLEDGCPMLDESQALGLIMELEAQIKMRTMTIEASGGGEVAWMKRLVEEHPVFADLPQDLKEALVRSPTPKNNQLGNRRQRKLWKKHGTVIHLFAGPDEGYTLKRAFKEVGGDTRLLVELDILREGSVQDLSDRGTGYETLLRMALDGEVKGWMGGPPCRTRSVLRHIEVPGVPDMPRPVRSWEEQFGMTDISAAEKEKVREDDILLFRYLLLFVISEEVRKVLKRVQKVAFGVEQPSPPKNPEVVTFWKTPQWKMMRRLYGMDQQNFNQATFGGIHGKPTTWGGNLRLRIPEEEVLGRKRKIHGKSKDQICQESRLLSRWVPGMMRAVAEKIQEEVYQKRVVLRRLSWKEHVLAEHTPFRRDCKVCQEASARDAKHVRSKLPAKAGILSLDVSGPFRSAQDLLGKEARYFLAGAFLWPSGDQDNPEEEHQVPEVEEGVVDFEEGEENEKDEEKDTKRDFVKRRNSEDQPVEEAYAGEEEEIEERKEVKMQLIRLVTPMPSRSQKDVMRAVMDFYLQLRMDGFEVTQIHTDRGGEFMSVALDSWCRARTILRTYTAGDEPQANGRVEQTVGEIKARTRRILHAAQAPFERWPLAIRCLSERFRREALKETSKGPNFMDEVLVRKRHWRSKEMEPTQERVKYVCPSWQHHGHWVERENGALVLTRVVLAGLQNPPERDHWIALEDDLSPLELRKRIREKSSMRSIEVRSREEKEEEEEDEDLELQLKIQRVIEEEMAYAVTGEQEAIGPTLDGIIKMREMMKEDQKEEVLQTRMISQGEVKTKVEEWKPSIMKELNSLLEEKKALRRIPEGEAKKWIQDGKAEAVPSKMVFTIKPEVGNPAGKKKSRLVACGNFLPPDPKMEVYASGTNGVSLRLAVAEASRRGWKGAITDVHTAFLNAPMNLLNDDQPDRVALMKPPMLLTSLNLIPSDEWWIVDKAVYGYRQSPKLWGDHRDRELEVMKIRREEGKGQLRLQQLISEPNLWRVEQDEDGPDPGALEGLVVVYVDDILVLGSEAVVEGVIKEVKKRWETSNVEWINATEGTRFLGAELWRGKDGVWKATQANYIQELLKKNLKGPKEDWKRKKTPIPKEAEDLQEEKTKSLEDTREAQKIVGELVWLVTRSRPDLMFATSRLAHYICLCPSKVRKLGQHVWEYLVSTVNDGLLFPKGSPEEEPMMELFSDASFSEHCQGCSLIKWAGSPILWRSSKQTITTSSTAEAELVELMDTIVSGEAVKVVVEEILDQRIKGVAFTDSSAALAIAVGDVGAWRTRHLKKRAHLVKKSVDRGDWLVYHMRGTEMPADAGTKALGGEKLKDLKKRMGMYVEDQKEGGGSRSEGTPKDGVPKETLVKALRMVMVAAQIAAVKGQGGRDEEERDDYVLMWTVVLLYTVIVVMMTTLVQWMWTRMSQGRSEEERLKEEKKRLQLEDRRQSEGRGGREGRSSNAAASSSSSALPSTSPRRPMILNIRDQSPRLRSPSPGPPPIPEPVPDVPLPFDEEHELPTEVLLTATGEKFHLDRECYGLRAARRIQASPLCRACQNQGLLRERILYAKNMGFRVHTRFYRACGAQDYHDYGALKEYQACSICVPEGWDTI